MTLYTLFHNTQTCRSCGRTESWSSLCTTEPHGSGTRHLAVHGSVPDGVPIVTVPIISKTVPLCVSCIPADAAQRGAEARALFEQARLPQSGGSPPPCAAGGAAAAHTHLGGASMISLIARNDDPPDEDRSAARSAASQAEDCVCLMLPLLQRNRQPRLLFGRRGLQPLS